MDSASVQSCKSFSRMNSVSELPGTSTSSKIIRSARDPVSCPVIPTDLTDGAWCGLQLTSKLILDHLLSSDLGWRCFNQGVSMMSFCRKIDMLSARSFDAEIIMTFLSASLNSVHNTNAPVIHDLPTPRNACTCKRFGPFCR